MPRLVNQSPTVKAKRGARCQEKRDERFSQSSQQNQTGGFVTISSLMMQDQKVADSLAAVVLCPPALSLLSPSTPRKRRASSRVQLLVGDASLEGGQCARVSLFVNTQSPSDLKSLLGVDGGQHVTTPSKSARSGSGGNHGMLRKGDLVVLSNMELRDVQLIQKSGEKRGPDPGDGGREEPGDGQLLDVVCDLAPSWTPSAHPSITRCFNVDQQSGEERDGRQDELLVPSDLADELVSWYRNKCILPKTHVPHRMNCQRRNVREIVSPNITSNVVVHVLRCERASDQWTPNKGTSSCVFLSHATLSDGPSSEDIIGLAMCNQHSVLPKSISRTLVQALSEGSRVLLSNVTSQSTATNHGGRESLVLVPSTDTTAQIITRDHPYYTKERKRVENSFISQPLTLERCSQLYSMTQQNSPSPLHGSTSKGLVAVVASLTDFVVDGSDSSFMESKAWKDPRSLSNLLVHNSSISTGMKAIDLRASYRSSTLTLDEESVSREIVVNADQCAMRLLCFDIPASALLISREDEEGEHPYLGHLGHMLRALCTEKAPIRWIIEQESERSWFVHSASLVKL